MPDNNLSPLFEIRDNQTVLMYTRFGGISEDYVSAAGAILDDKLDRETLRGQIDDLMQKIGGTPSELRLNHLPVLDLNVVLPYVKGTSELADGRIVYIGGLDLNGRTVQARSWTPERLRRLVPDNELKDAPILGFETFPYAISTLDTNKVRMERKTGDRFFESDIQLKYNPGGAVLDEISIYYIAGFGKNFTTLELKFNNNSTGQAYAELMTIKDDVKVVKKFGSDGSMISKTIDNIAAEPEKVKLDYLVTARNIVSEFKKENPNRQELYDQTSIGYLN